MGDSVPIIFIPFKTLCFSFPFLTDRAILSDDAKILSTRFGAAYAKGRDKFIHGEVKGIKGKI